MATYIGIKKTTLNSYNITPSDIKCVVDTGSKTSFVLNLTKSDPWTINGTFYIVYKVGTNSYDITSTCFVHSHNDLNIKTIDDLPLNSRVIYCSSLSNSFSGGSGWPSGIIYYFDTVLDVKKSNTWHQKTIPHELAGTSYDYIYHNTNQSTASSGKCTDYGFCPTSSSDGVSIVELYHSTNGVTNATELYTSIINRGETWSSGAYKSWIYDYYRESNTGAIFPARIKGIGRKVFAIHNITGGDCNLAIMYGGSTSATLSNTNYTTGAFGYTKVAYNTWAHHNTQDGKHYYSITVSGNNKFIETTLQLEVYKAYNIKIHTYSEANYDGIVISTIKLTSASLSSSSTAGITRCSGVDKTVTYTHTVSTSSSRTLYIYFKTDASTLKGPGDIDSTGASTSTTSSYSTGDIEIENVYVITFDANGGTGGPGKISVPAGESLNLSTITKPTRSGWSFYKWSKNDSNFNFVPNKFTPTGHAILYAIWDNRPTYTLFSDRSVYCTDDCIATSSTQGSKSIRLFSGTGMTCSAGTVGCVVNKSKVYPVGSPNSPISGATIQPTGRDNNVTVPSGTPAGDYIAAIAVFTSASTSTPGSYYGPTSDQPAVYQIQFTIKATTLTYGTVELIQHTPDDIIEGNIIQHKRFPAGSFTISPSTIGDYFSPDGVFRQVVTCNNGRVREGNLTVQGWRAMPNFSNIVVPSLGTTETSQYTYTFANDNGDALVFVAEGEGNKLFQKFILSGVREANTLTDTNYAPYSYIARVAIGNGLTAGGGEAAVTASASHMAYDYYTSGSYNNPHGVSDGVSWSITSQYINSSGNHIERFTQSGNTLSHTTMGTSVGTDYVTVTAYNTTSTSATASAEKSITNEVVNSDYNASNSNYNVSVNIGSGLNAGKSDAAVSVSGSHTHTYYYYYTSGSTSGPYTATHSDSPTWSITSQYINSSGNHIERFTQSGNTLSHTSITSNVGTDYVKITATNSSNTSTTSTAEKSITNELGTQKYKNTSGTTGYNIVYTVPTVSIRSELSAAGGTATVTCSVTNNTNWYQKYTSGTYTSQKTSTETGTARWMITSNGNSRFSHPSSGGTSLSGVGTVYNTGTKISHSNMTTNATTDTVTVTAYNIGDISKTKTASASVSNALTGISISLGSNPINYNTTTTATVTATYTSGLSKDVTSSLSTSSSATSNYIKSGNTNIVTVS